MRSVLVADTEQAHRNCHSLCIFLIVGFRVRKVCIRKVRIGIRIPIRNDVGQRHEHAKALAAGDVLVPTIRGQR